MLVEMGFCAWMLAGPTGRPEGVTGATFGASVGATGVTWLGVWFAADGGGARLGAVGATLGGVLLGAAGVLTCTDGMLGEACGPSLLGTGPAHATADNSTHEETM
jgi:hypothetical protein